jgi:hypothetical protein
MVVHSIFNKNRGCLAIDHRPEAHTHLPTFVSLPQITFLDFWWRPFPGQKFVGVSLWYYLKWSFMAIFGFLVETISWSKIRSRLPFYYWKWAFILFSTKMRVVWPLIIDRMVVHLTPHMLPCHWSHSWISGGDHFLVKNLWVLAFGIIENGRWWLFLTKMEVVWPLIIDQRLVHLTTHMFPWCRSHSWISGGDHFLAKNS